ncbi:MAG: [protein-PII] uridylyltransferase [Acidimicrobiales bacterium]
MGLERGVLLADDALTGSAWCRAHSDLIDAWLVDLLERATEGATAGVALVAVGGYGRAELCPQSDIDVMLVHEPRTDVTAIADRVWYPIWDAGMHLGHSVWTVKAALQFASDDLDSATALLNARHVAGDAGLTARLAQGAASQWERRSKAWLTALDERVRARHTNAGEVAFRLEPDLKDGRGGLRDVHSLHWAEAAHRIMLDHDSNSLAAAYAVLLDVRVELQRHTRGKSNVLALQDQDAVAAALGDGDADALTARIAEAARAIAWTSDDTWRRIQAARRGSRGRGGPKREALGDGIFLQDGEVHLDHGTPPADDLVLALRAATLAAHRRTVIDRASLEWLATGSAPLSEPWPAEALALLAELLLTGSAAIDVIEALDQRGIWTRILPEWQPVRAHPQRNAYHRFTVDRHLLETAANAARLAARVRRPDLLVVTALLHDLGKGRGGDHTEMGVALANGIAARMGYPPADVASIAALIEHHLLLSEVATRRDLDDPTTIARVAAAVGSTDQLALLAALTEADSLATGHSAWGPWKAELVGQLVQRVEHVLGGGELSTVVVGQFPTPKQMALLAAGGRHVVAEDDTLTVVSDDRPGLFSRISGVLSLHGLDVLAAAAYSSDGGRALAQFRVADPVRDHAPWDRVTADLNRVLDGRLALDARLAERAWAYRHPAGRTSTTPKTTVTFDDDASADATVIDVRAPDGIGVLYRITRAMAELELDIRTAKVATLGNQVLDAFYVRDRRGHKIDDPHVVGEVKRAILHSLREAAPAKRNPHAT